MNRNLYIVVKHIKGPACVEDVNVAIYDDLNNALARCYQEERGDRVGGTYWVDTVPFFSQFSKSFSPFI